MKVGDVVRILKPDYLIGLLGTIEGSEVESDRWIIKLEKSPFEDNQDKPVLLSLPESDFEVIEFESWILSNWNKDTNFLTPKENYS